MFPELSYVTTYSLCLLWPQIDFFRNCEHVNFQTVFLPLIIPLYLWPGYARELYNKPEMSSRYAENSRVSASKCGTKGR